MQLEQIPVPSTDRPRKIALIKGILECRTVNELGICSSQPVHDGLHSSQ